MGLTLLGLGFIAPPARAAAPAPAIVHAKNYYEGGSTGSRRTLTWRAPTSTANAGVLANLSTLRDRSRAAVRNDGYAKAAIDRLVTNIVGTGITLRSQAADPAFRKQVDTLFETWTESSDAGGLLDWYGQQTQAVRSWLEGGDAFIRIRLRQPGDGLPVPLQLEILESEFCPHTFNDFGRRIRGGIEFDAIGRRIAYHFYKSRPELDDLDLSQLVRVPAEFVIPMYDPLRPGQLRGVPQLTQALVQLYELDKYRDAHQLRQQIANLFVGFIKRPLDQNDPQINPLTGLSMDTDALGAPMASLEPGIFQQLDPGDDVTFSNPPGAGDNYEAFMCQQLRNAAVAAGVPYEVLTNDLSKLNDRTVRVVLHEFRRRIMAVQHQIVGFQLCRRVHRAFMDRAFLSGALAIPGAYATDPMPWAKVDWTPHGWPYLNPVQDVQSQRDAARSGFTSRRALVSEQGEDVEAIDADNAEDKARADALGLVYDVDPSRVSMAGVTQARPAGSEPLDANTGDAGSNA